MPSALDLPSRNAIGRTERFDAIARLPFAFIGIRTHDARVEEICFLPGDLQPRPPANALAQRVVDQLLAYCADSSTAIDLPLAIEGIGFSTPSGGSDRPHSTRFDRNVWQIARRLNGEARAVGQACGDNRLPLAIPCHRVVAASGIGGFAHHRGGAYEAIKRWLLMHEAGSELRLT